MLSSVAAHLPLYLAGFVVVFPLEDCKTMVSKVSSVHHELSPKHGSSFPIAKSATTIVIKLGSVSFPMIFECEIHHVLRSIGVVDMSKGLLLHVLRCQNSSNPQPWPSTTNGKTLVTDTK
ncbi:hypothetical protein PanWU01x14_181760 [Parasponia andersonii]|uniref:Uncharacterized protein n=1 Tax=Parasponia andersonii TaxID=3476 RepID=A0A2P5C5P5_PARAD|nr:hypothetical protein PanWU01x14_181760 [Parasponia andersonii]